MQQPLRIFNFLYAGRFYCVRIFRCFIRERLSYHCFYASFFNQTVEREDVPSITVPLSAVFHIRYQVLSVFPPFLWRPLEGVKNVEFSTSVDRSFDHFSLFELCFGLVNPVSWRSFVSLKTSIWRCVRDNNIR